MREWKWIAAGAVVLSVFLLGSGVAFGEGTNSQFRYGADIRIREAGFNDIPISADPPGITRGGENNFFRFRTRVWGEFDPAEDVTLRARLVNEFRLWHKPDSPSTLQRSNYDYPDEVVFDNLYLQLRNLAAGDLDVTIGRQELIYGTGKVILEGTPKDGSRTIYFNAAKATWKGFEATTIDLFGIVDPSQDPLAMNDADRDLTGYTSANDDMTEKGLGLYLKNKSAKEFPVEAYLIYKRESQYNQAASRDADGNYVEPSRGWQTLDAGRGVIVNDALDLTTVGTRLMPVFGERLKGNFEFAYQAGERGDVDVTGFMVDGFLVYNPPVLEDMKPAIDFGIYYISGDDPDTDEDEGWNPLFARWPQYSELYVYAFDADGAGRWSNVSLPHAGVALSPFPWLKTSAMVGYLMAPQDNGPGDGNVRGWLEVVKAEFTIREKILSKRDKLSGHLWLELLQPGDYYNVDSTAYFARWQLVYEF